MEMEPEVSVVIRSRNNIDHIAHTMEMMRFQKFKDFEIINVDSSSSDGTFDVIERFKSRAAYQVRVEDYTPGKILNEAVKKCKGKILVFNNADSIPADENWLEKLVAPLRHEATVVASYSRQIPRKDAKPIVVRDFKNDYGERAKVVYGRHFFSLASCAIRKEMLTEYPFDEKVRHFEDFEWAWLIKNKGYRIVYCKDSAVEHSHNYTFSELYERYYDEGLVEGAIYKRSKFDRSFLMLFAKPFSLDVFRDLLYLLRTLHWASIPYSFAYRAVQNFACWKGNRDRILKGV